MRTLTVSVTEPDECPGTLPIDQVTVVIGGPFVAQLFEHEANDVFAGIVSVIVVASEDADPVFEYVNV